MTFLKSCYIVKTHRTGRTGPTSLTGGKHEITNRAGAAAAARHCETARLQRRRRGQLRGAPVGALWEAEAGRGRNRNHLRRNRRHGRTARRHGCGRGPAAAGLVFQELAGPAAPVSVRSRQADRGQGLHDCERGVKLRKLIYAKSYDSGIC